MLTPATLLCFCPTTTIIKRLLWIKENQTSPLKEFSTFLWMGRCKSLGSLKSLLWYAPQLSVAWILCFLILSLFRVHPQGWLPRVTAAAVCWAAVMWRFDGCNIPSLLIWQATISIDNGSMVMLASYQPEHIQQGLKTITE